MNSAEEQIRALFAYAASSAVTIGVHPNLDAAARARRLAELVVEVADKHRVLVAYYDVEVDRERQRLGTDPPGTVAFRDSAFYTSPPLAEAA